MIFISKTDPQCKIEAFYFNGPFTEFPEWFLELYKEGKVRYDAHKITILDRESCGYPNKDTCKTGRWLYRYVSGRGVMYVMLTQELRERYYTADFKHGDEGDEFFEQAGVVRAERIEPVRYYVHVWDGHAHKVPVWLQAAVSNEQVTMGDRKLYSRSGMRREALPGDYIISKVGNGDMINQVHIFTPEEYKAFMERK